VNGYWGALAFAIGASVVGQTLLKAGSAAPNFLAQLFDPRTILGLALYGGSALLYIVALRRIPMSVALPCTAVSYVLAVIIGHFGFHEPLGIARLAGVGIICVGVVTLTIA
jgi:small multidrug resistance pump